MKTAKHTPGPWNLEDGNSLVLQANLTHAFQIRAGETAEVIADIITDGEWKETNDEANAKLIAAAPDMLEALLNLENDDNSIPAALWEKVKSAIEKATA